MFLHVPCPIRCVLHRSFKKTAFSRAWLSTAGGNTDIRHLTISDVGIKLTKPNNLYLVPQNYVKHAPDGTVLMSQSTLHNLRWMIQKDLLKQDMFLLGGPGPFRRRLVMQFLELTQRELEYVSLSRDTTESDLKQRREIQNNNVIYQNQGAVRAALHGRVLILDGIEHVESNVLPVLNNLMENREMHLESGQFLMAPERYDELLKTHNQQQLTERGILRVSENFRVIALGLPVHKFKGTPLDPPLRSRFQCRHISSFNFSELDEELQQLTPAIPYSHVKQLLGFALTIQEVDETLQLPDFPFHKLYHGVQMMESNPALPLPDVVKTMYPYQSMLKTDQLSRIEELLKDLSPNYQPNQNVKCIKCDSEKDGFIDVHIDSLKLRIPCGSTIPRDEKFVDLPHQRQVLSSLLQAFAVGDVCLLGEKGVGKQTLVKQLLRLLRQSAEPIMIYEDMTSRDLIQQRITDADGATIWQDSPLVCAAKNGTVAVLNGLHRLHKSTASLLQRIIHDRELQLLDGTILLGSDRYQSLLRLGLTGNKLSEHGVFPIHNSFRIVALAEPPNSDIGKPSWMTPDLLSLFLYEEVRPLKKVEEEMLVRQNCGQVQPQMQQLLNLAQFLRCSKDPLFKSLATILSTRQLIKIGRRLAAFPASDLSDIHEILHNIFMVKFLPAPTRAALEEALIEVGINKFSSSKKSENNCKQISVQENVLRIGETEMQIFISTLANESKVPSSLFYDIPQHVVLLESMLQDFLTGEHLLLVGNQGVGKNKLVDRLLALMRRPREYLQLHRDTTVQSLTQLSTLRDGKVVFEDSPLVKAVKLGHVLVIDEADKAPLNVTCVLRSLVENGEILLSDGRRIVPSGFNALAPNIIEMHSDFRLIILGNRPGFPFLGNDFFAALGDLFSCHVINNPTPSSEIFLLQKYGPNVPIKVLTKLVNGFGELRNLADEGVLNYPYSTREVINIVKHLQCFPDDNISEVMRNVLDFDRYQTETVELICKVLSKHGLKIECQLGHRKQFHFEQKLLHLSINDQKDLEVSGPKFGKLDLQNKPHVGGNTWAGGSGGRDTAGLGGKGGPFRLNAGHSISQLSEEQKDNIPNEIKRRAKEMNRKAYEDKLQEIQMSDYDHKLYTQFSQPNQQQVQQLRTILEAIQAKNQERQWQKYQVHGELDDTRLIDGVTGDKNIFRRRTVVRSWAQEHNKPNRLKLVVDVSGSMYRFNGHDGRLDRQLEAVVMVMEAFQGFEEKIIYDVVGHSGEGWELPFIKVGDAPKNDKERLEAIRVMHAHSKFCWSGDSTVKAAREACLNLSTELDYDNGIVVLLSDANLERYGIAPKDLTQALKGGEPKVKGFVIFIGSLAEEADNIKSKMAAGQSYVCMDITKLPQILKQIFTTVLQ